VLLCVYAFVIARAVRRGDTDFDCGCTASASRPTPLQSAQEMPGPT